MLGKCIPFFFLMDERLQEKGIETFLLSGDREEAVASVGKMVGIPKHNISASLTPQHKSGAISSLKAKGHHVAMVYANSCSK